MRELPAGRDALLLDFSDSDVPWRSALDVAERLRTAVRAGDLPTVVDVVPAEQTVLVQCIPGRGLDHLGLRRALRTVVHATDVAPDDRAREQELAPVIVDVRYDGVDLADVAEFCDMHIDQVIAVHTATTWRVQFMGFAPGFGYLVPHQRITPSEPDAEAADTADADALRSLNTVPRRDSSRTAVPAGSVAVAAGYSAIYPRTSPGGWHLLGRTTFRLWDIDADPPAALAPGRLVQFRPA